METQKLLEIITAGESQRERSLVIGYGFSRPAPQVVLSDGLDPQKRKLGTIRQGMQVAIYVLEYNEAYLKDFKSIRVEYDDQILTFFDHQGNLLKNKATLDSTFAKLVLRINDNLKTGALSRDEVTAVRFIADDDVKIKGGSFNYSLHFSGWLATAFTWLGLSAFVVLVGGGFAFCGYKRMWPNDAYRELNRYWGRRLVLSVLVGLIVLWLGGCTAGSLLS